MSSVLDILGDQFDDSTLRGLGRQIGADEDTTGRAVAAALPVLLAALSRNAENPAGATDLLGALERDHDGSLLDDLGGFLGQGGATGGEAAEILGHVLGPDRGRVEQGLGKAAGLDAQKIGRLLMVLAPIVMAALGRAKRRDRLDPGGLSDVLARDRQRADRAGAGGLASILLDQNRDGSVMDDVARIGSGVLGSLFKR